MEPSTLFSTKSATVHAEVVTLAATAGEARIDVAPTLLALLELPRPTEMTKQNLVVSVHADKIVN